MLLLELLKSDRKWSVLLQAGPGSGLIIWVFLAGTSLVGGEGSKMTTVHILYLTLILVIISMKCHKNHKIKWNKNYSMKLVNCINIMLVSRTICTPSWPCYCSRREQDQMVRFDYSSIGIYYCWLYNPCSLWHSSKHYQWTWTILAGVKVELNLVKYKPRERREHSTQSTPPVDCRLDQQ